MKLKIRYEDQLTTLDVPEADCFVMIQTDYEERLAAAEDKASVAPRTAQEILDERFNRPEYNNWHTYNRHHADVSSPRHSADDADAERDFLDTIEDNSQAEYLSAREDYEELCQLLRSRLKPAQAELLIAVHLDGVSLRDYAAQVGTSYDTIRQRLCVAEKNFKKIFPESSQLPLCRG